MPGNRAGPRNPFHGHRHTDAWKQAQSERQNTWTTEELTLLRRWYADRDDRPLMLNDLAVQLGRPKTSVCRMAKACGLTHTSRPTGRKPRAKYGSAEERLVAAGRASRERIAQNGHPRGMLGKSHTPETRAHLAQLNRGRVMDLTDAQRQSLSDRATAMQAARSPEENPYARSRYGRREDLGGMFFRSSWEANYARYLNWQLTHGMIIAWAYESETFWFEAIRRGVRSYKPDFLVTKPDGSQHRVEVKGWMDPKSKTKLARMAKYYPDVDLRVVDARAYREIERKLSGAIPGWERKGTGADAARGTMEERPRQRPPT